MWYQNHVINQIIFLNPVDAYMSCRCLNTYPYVSIYVSLIAVQKDDEILLKHTIQEEEKREDSRIVLEALEDIHKNMFM